jgi:hypothetical protein
VILRGFLLKKLKIIKTQKKPIISDGIASSIDQRCSLLHVIFYQFQLRFISFKVYHLLEKFDGYKPNFIGANQTWNFKKNPNPKEI